jgi:glycosyltransferase involved in cell wall biosynthesis
MTKPLLSICIATLNRAEFLGVMLESIVSQATDDIEIVIVDGASTDNTGQVVEGYQKRFAGIRYFRLSVKGGVDQDYNRAVELAEGDYCWLLSDDDRLTPGAVQAVLDAMDQDPALIIVNAEVRNYDLSMIVVDKMLAFDTDRTYLPTEQERLLVETANYLTFIGCVVIKREIWMQSERSQYYGTAFIHVGVIFGASLKGTAIALAKPWIMVRYSNASWGSRAFSIWAFRWPGLIWSFAGYRDESKRRVCVREPWRNKKGLLMYRAKGMYSLKEYQEWLAPHLTSRFDRLTAQSIASFPGVLANLGIWVYFTIFLPNDHFAFADLRDSPFYYGKIFRRA